MRFKHLIYKRALWYCMITATMFWGSVSFADSNPAHWQSPFEKATIKQIDNDSLSLNDIVGLVAEKNPILKSLKWHLESAEGNLRQAGLWSNPELELELEEFGWNAPGFRETEMAIILSQELEIFGQRGARKQHARANIDYTKWKNQKLAFDLYLDAKMGYFKMAHAQDKARLAREAMELAQTIYNNIEDRHNKGAALQSGLLLSRLELLKAQLESDEALRDRKNASMELSALWGTDDSGVVVEDFGIDCHECLKNITELDVSVDSCGEIIEMLFQKDIIDSESRLLAAEAKPALTFSGGVKRLQGDKANSFILGLSLPLPFVNRNQGERAGLQADIKALKLEINERKARVSSTVRSHIGKIVQLDEKLEITDSLLLPTAEKTYESLTQAYNAGRIPYTSLLEGERALIDLRFDKNNIFLNIRELQIELERIIGIPLESIKK
ncbi:MAG: TolC family protein [candidate division Zixibacteria bacterium]